jgi:hypothetical protein
MNIIMLIIKYLPTVIQIIKLIMEIINGLPADAKAGAKEELFGILREAKVDGDTRAHLKARLEEFMERLKQRE